MMLSTASVIAVVIIPGQDSSIVAAPVSMRAPSIFLNGPILRTIVVRGTPSAL
ncbi:hypothetical protein [Candidatus Manganitrophus noduliformans]|uniref:hypothetical protein n=1 Tax=Candidatus Manganitrophus noduliformans TaxID=2606439 RepID=UPI00143A4323|nr:hypothetical protein [Candidatus Manganitrophus noduliformans]